MTSALRTLRRSWAAIILMVVMVVIFTDIGAQSEEKVTPSGQRVLLPEGSKPVQRYRLTYKDYVITVTAYSDERIGHPDFGSYSLSIEESRLDLGLVYYEYGFPPPSNSQQPVAIVEQKRGPTLLIMDTILGRDRNPSLLRVWELQEPYNHISLRLGGSANFELRDIIGDWDGDGLVEVLNLELREPGTGRNFPAVSADLGVRSVYRYVPGGGLWGVYASVPFPRFERVKGMAFEKNFMDHARMLIEEKYPQLIKETRYLRTAESVVMSWLATVESTQNPERIREALRHLESLPFPDKPRKEEIVELLVRDGYKMLKEVKP